MGADLLPYVAVFGSRSSFVGFDSDSRRGCDDAIPRCCRHAETVEDVCDGHLNGSFAVETTAGSVSYCDF